VRRGSFKVSASSPIQIDPMDFLVIEWFMLQNPKKSFTKRRPQLPGQEHPGLGISILVYEILYWVARRMKADGVILVPNYLHTGIFYSRQFLFLNPEKQGLILTIKKHLLRKYDLDQLTWASAEGQLMDIDKAKPFIWEPAPMAIPVSSKLRDYFHSRNYNEITRSIRDETRLKISSDYKKNYNSAWEAM
jgi:hypothetical protein